MKFSVKGSLLAFLPLIFITAAVFYYVREQKNEDKTPKKNVIFKLNENPKEKIETEDYEYKASLEIKGDDKFKEQIKQSLKLIWLSDKDSFSFIKKYIFEIRQENKTCFYIDSDNKPVIGISDDMAYKSLTWTAGIIAHNSWHGYKEIAKKEKKEDKIPLPGEKKEMIPFQNLVSPPPQSFDEFLNSEKEAYDFQLEILEKIGAPKNEIKKIKNRDPKDFSLSHDGSCLVK
jgi:hypothetical protein